jgi:uncharacterized protein
MKQAHMVSIVLILVGALNWGLVGLANFDLVGTLLGHGSVLSRIIYIVVGLAAAFQIAHFAATRRCACSARPVAAP